jgi:hypothetical protein
MTVNECSTGFKNKEEYVKLPAYIGQPVFILGSNHKYMDGKFTLVGWEVKEGKVSMIQQKADKSWKFRVTINSSVCDYTLDKVGNDIFFSEDEAITKRDKRLKEINL